MAVPIEYIIMTPEEADDIGKIQLDGFEMFNPYAGPLLTDPLTYAVPRLDILTEYAKYGVLGQITSKVNIAQLPHRTVAGDEWDHTGWGPPPV